MEKYAKKKLFLFTNDGGGDSEATPHPHVSHCPESTKNRRVVKEVTKMVPVCMWFQKNALAGVAIVTRFAFWGHTPKRTWHIVKAPRRQRLLLSKVRGRGAANGAEGKRVEIRVVLRAAEHQVRIKGGEVKERCMRFPCTHTHAHTYVYIYIYAYTYQY